MLIAECGSIKLTKPGLYFYELTMPAIFGDAHTADGKIYPIPAGATYTAQIAPHELAAIVNALLANPPAHWTLTNKLEPTND